MQRGLRRLAIVFAASLIAFCGARQPSWAGALEDGIAFLDAGQYRAARDAFLKAAEAGNAEAQVQLAMLLLDRSVGPVDRAAAAKWLQEAAERNHADAQYRLGLLLYDSGKGDIQAAARWFEKSAMQSNPDAAYSFAGLLETGKGVKRDLARALTFYRQAAEGGVLKAEHTLGAMLAFGRNVAPDAIEGGMWLELALQGGDRDVVRDLERSRSTRTSDQDAEIKRRVATHLRRAAHH